MSTATRLITADELFLMPEDETQWCELIDGELVQMSPPGGVHGVVGGVLSHLVRAHVHKNKLGIVVAAETGFLISRNPDTVLAPDGAFIRRERIDAAGIPKSYFQEAPALVWEVLSPRDSMAKVAAKMHRWFQAGVELAWVVDPMARIVTTYRGADEILVQTERDVLSGGKVLPRFKCKIAELFADL